MKLQFKALSVSLGFVALLGTCGAVNSSTPDVSDTNTSVEISPDETKLENTENPELEASETIEDAENAEVETPELEASEEIENPELEASETVEDAENAEVETPELEASEEIENPELEASETIEDAENAEVETPELEASEENEVNDQSSIEGTGEDVINSTEEAINDVESKF